MKRSEMIQFLVDETELDEGLLDEVLTKIENKGMIRNHWFPETNQEVKDILNENIYPPHNICNYIREMDRKHPDFKGLFWALNNAVRKTSSMWKQSNIGTVTFVLSNPWEPEE